jgi:drug/metabolite transporter (DMT)-like permease
LVFSNKEYFMSAWQLLVRRRQIGTAVIAVTCVSNVIGLVPAGALVVSPTLNRPTLGSPEVRWATHNACVNSNYALQESPSRPFKHTQVRGGAAAMRLSGGGGADSSGDKKRWLLGSKILGSESPLRERAELLFLITLWYATSVVCTNTTKSIGAHWSVLTFSQLVISTLCGLVVVCGFGYKKYEPIANADQLQKTAILAAVFTLGFVTLNWCLGLMHVSLVMTLRATEPMFTLFLASILLRAEPATWKMFAALLPVIAGAALSSLGSADATLLGLAVVFICNVCFALRGVVTKRIKTAYPVDEFNLFLQISAIGAAAYGVVLLAANLLLAPSALHIPALAALVDVSQLLRADRVGAVLLNGVTFYAYLQVYFHLF